jgi:hypothetical protein
MSMTWRQLRNILKDFDLERLDNIAQVDVFIKNDLNGDENNYRTETLDIEFDDDKCLIVDTRF